MFELNPNVNITFNCFLRFVSSGWLDANKLPRQFFLPAVETSLNVMSGRFWVLDRVLAHQYILIHIYKDS
jgi:hypothetical protein